MQRLTILMFVTVTLVEFLAHGDRWGRWEVLPGAATYLAELLGIAAVIVVVFAGTRNRFQFVRPAYWFVFGTLLVVIACGIVSNGVDSGPVFAGIRNYMRAIPWFLVPAVVTYSDRQISTQLRALLVLALLQIPFAVQQRLSTVAQGSITGDMTAGTLLLSGALSIFLICAMCIVSAFFVRKLLRPWQFILLFVTLLLPTTINETKVTIFLLPIGLLAAFVAASEAGERAKHVLQASVLLALFGAAFFPIYDRMQEGRAYTVTLKETLTDPDRMERYLWKDKAAGTTERVGKVDSIVVPLRRLSADPVTLMFGYGIGNVSDSALGHGFKGRYNEVLGAFLTTTFGRIVLETGILGLACVLALMWLILLDAIAVARRSTGVIGALAAGWVGVTVVIGLCIAYADLVPMAALSYLFWYGSGLIAAARMKSVVPLRARDSHLPGLKFHAGNTGSAVRR
jgi:hypothetical protein